MRKFLKTLKFILDGRLLSIQDAVLGLGLFRDDILNVAFEGHLSHLLTK